MFRRIFSGKRRHQFIDKKQQVRFAISVALFSLLFPLLFLGLAISPTLSALLIGEEAERIQPLITQLVDFCVRHWWLVLLNLLFIAVASVLFSHLIFGPMRRFEIVLKQKQENPAESVFSKLRKGDYFHEFSMLFDEVLNGLQAAENPAQSMEKEDPEPEAIDPAPPDSS